MTNTEPIVLEIIQLGGDVVLFGDDRTAPTMAVSVPRLVWEEILENLPTVTVTLEPGGDFVRTISSEKPEEPSFPAFHPPSPYGSTERNGNYL